ASTRRPRSSILTKIQPKRPKARRTISMRYRFILLLPSTTTRRPVDLEGVGRMAATATDDLLNAWVGARAGERRGLRFEVGQDPCRGLRGCDGGRQQRAVDLAMAAAQPRHEVVHLRIEV